jgi:hypothetical protein
MGHLGLHSLNQVPSGHRSCLDQLNTHIRSSPCDRHTRSQRRRLGTICSASPPTTCSQAVSEARSALRRYRETQKEKEQDSSNAAAATTDADRPTPLLKTTKNRLTVTLPVPSPSYKDDDDLLRPFDEGEWPGGIQQRFRALRPLVENFIDSFGSPTFVGMLESPADGLGVWTAFNGAATVVTFVNNATFAPFVRLCQGDFGSKIEDPTHVLIAINPNWTQSKDIGQLWDKTLRAKAAELIDTPPNNQEIWLPLYHLEDLRTAAGSLGILWRSYPGPWRLYSAVVASDLLVEGTGEEERGNIAGRIGDLLSGRSNDDSLSALVAVDLLLEGDKRPERSEIIKLLNDANKIRKEKEKETKKNKPSWWGGL